MKILILTGLVVIIVILLLLIIVAIMAVIVVAILKIHYASAGVGTRRSSAGTT